MPFPGVVQCCYRLLWAAIPHHVTQRGNRWERTFFKDSDYAVYLNLLAVAAGRMGVEIRSHCLMPNHVYVIAALTYTISPAPSAKSIPLYGYINARLQIIAEFRGHNTNWPVQKHAT